MIVPGSVTYILFKQFLSENCIIRVHICYYKLYIYILYGIYTHGNSLVAWGYIRTIDELIKLSLL